MVVSEGRDSVDVGDSTCRTTGAPGSVQNLLWEFSCRIDARPNAATEIT